MKIAFIGQKGIPARSGGVEHHVQELALRLSSVGHAITVYARTHYSKKYRRTYKNVRLVYLPSVATKNFDAITHTFLATFHALFSNYDIVHYQSIGPASLAWLIRMLRPDIKVINTFHCKDYEHQKWGWFARLYLRFGEFVTCVVPHELIVVNQELQQYVKAAYGVDALYIPNGSAVSYVAGVKTLKKWRLAHKMYILAVSRLVKHKELHTLIEAFMHLKRAQKLNPEMKLVIIGSGAYTNAYVKELKQLAASNKNIIFTGEQEGKSLQELYSHAALFVHPSLSEGLSLALLEAMGYGLPVVASDIIENREAVGASALTFEARNVDDLAAKIAWLVSHPLQAKLLGRAAKARAQKYFDWNRIADQILEVYERALKIQKGIINNQETNTKQIPITNSQ